MKNLNKKPIGIFDSGIGGLTVLKEIAKQLPKEEIVYFGDTAHVPYGTKSKETITKFSMDNVRFLQGFETKMVVVACNSASSACLELLKQEFSFPVIGVIEPGAREAAEKTKNGRIGIIGTKATIGSGAYETCIKKLAPKAKVYSAACPLFVPFVEEGWTEGDVVEQVAELYLKPLKNFGVDTLVLGCTHYPLLKDVIQKVIGSHVHLVNSAEATARAAFELLKKEDILNKNDKHDAQQFYVSDEPEQFRMLGERFLGHAIPNVAKVADYVSS